MSTQLNTPNILGRTLFNLRSAWQQMNILKSDEAKLKPDLPEADRIRLRQQMHDCLEGKGGNVSARARAAKLGEAYLCLNETGRLRFLKLLAEDFGVNNEAIKALASQITNPPTDANLPKLHQQMRNALRPAGLELLMQFNSLPSGVKFLVDLRADLIRLPDKNDPELRELDKSLKDLLRSWFDVGFLDLVRLSWSTPAAILETLIHYEAVHAIQSWDDLKNRLESDRRCFAFFHPRMPDEPLIFVQVALVKHLSGNIQELLDESAPLGNPHEANTAIFYSITNTQVGLSGVGFGDFLIKRVVGDLKNELPNIKTFSTLSPIPGFMQWLKQQPEAELLTDKEQQNLDLPESASGLITILGDGQWHNDTVLVETLKKPLMRLVTQYLYQEKRRHRALDPVANFHLNNGARMERINWLADTSEKGLKASAGMMVNYLYKLDEIEANHEAYRETANINASGSVINLLK